MHVYNPLVGIANFGELLQTYAECLELLKEVLKNDPFFLLKWIMVFAVLIGSYRIVIPLFAKLEYLLSIERKRDIAIERDHIIPAYLESSRRSQDKDGNWDLHAKYKYTINGKEKIFHGYFTNQRTPYRMINLYYLNNPKRVFCFEEYHWTVPQGLLLLPVYFAPWFLAAFTMVVLNLHKYFI